MSVQKGCLLKGGGGEEYPHDVVWEKGASKTLVFL